MTLPPMNLVEQLGREAGKSSLPQVRVGDTVRVHYLIREGDKERVQPYLGTLIAIRGRGIAKSIIVRRIVQGEGVERIFPLHSPRVKDVEVVRRGKVRRAKLYFLRERIGKSTRVGELLGERARRLEDDPGEELTAARKPTQDDGKTDPEPQAVEV